MEDKHDLNAQRCLQVDPLEQGLFASVIIEFHQRLGLAHNLIIDIINQSSFAGKYSSPLVKKAMVPQRLYHRQYTFQQQTHSIRANYCQTVQSAPLVCLMTDAGGRVGTDTSGIWDKTEEQDFVKLIKELDSKSNSALSQPELLLLSFLAGIICVFCTQGAIQVVWKNNF